MKKYEKLNLKSDIYKQRKSKSPFTSQNHEDYSQNSSIKKSYQNICCPNCRYLFKVIREQLTPPQTAKRSRVKEIQRIAVSTQTQEIFRKNQFKGSPKKQSIKTERTPIKRIFDLQTSRMKQEEISKVSEKLKNGSITPNKGNKNGMKSSYIHKTNSKKSQQSLFPSRSIYTEQKTQSQPRIFSKVSNLKSSREVYEQNNENQTNEQINELIDRIYLSEQIKEILHYNMDQSPQISMPSYCKMLLYDFMDRKKDKKNTYD